MVRSKDGVTFLNSKPCSNCLTLLKKYNIFKIIYSTSDGYFMQEDILTIENDHISKRYKKK